MVTEWHDFCKPPLFLFGFGGVSNRPKHPSNHLAITPITHSSIVKTRNAQSTYSDYTAMPLAIQLADVCPFLSSLSLSLRVMCLTQIASYSILLSMRSRRFIYSVDLSLFKSICHTCRLYRSTKLSLPAHSEMNLLWCVCKDSTNEKILCFCSSMWLCKRETGSAM